MKQVWAAGAQRMEYGKWGLSLSLRTDFCALALAVGSFLLAPSRSATNNFLTSGEVGTMELEQRDAEAEALCHGMTERLRLLHEKRAILSSELREFSARSGASSSERLIAADNAVAVMATAGLTGVLAGVAAARFFAARRTNRSRPRRGGGVDETKRFDWPPPKAPSS